MARKAFTEHPDFIVASRAAHDALVAAAIGLNCADKLDSFEAHAGRVVDEMTKLLLKARDKSIGFSA